MYPVRTSVKAIIIHENRLLVTKNKKNTEIFYALPGGGQNLNEDLHSALKRECLEEVGADIKIKELAIVRDYIANNHEFRTSNPDFHQLELMFTCEILNFDNLHNFTEADTYQIGVEWLPISDLESYMLYPLTIRKKIKEINGEGLPSIYIGDVN